MNNLIEFPRRSRPTPELERRADDLAELASTAFQSYWSPDFAEVLQRLLIERGCEVEVTDGRVFFRKGPLNAA